MPGLHQPKKAMRRCIKRSVDRKRKNKRTEKVQKDNTRHILEQNNQRFYSGGWRVIYCVNIAGTSNGKTGERTHAGNENNEALRVKKTSVL
ncbi:hypothetical protein SNQ22_002974 [Cronobacter universalis]|nr:hypothetical protein [Cronobacter universalis]